jgi:RHS repeat-associated protein
MLVRRRFVVSVSWFARHVTGLAGRSLTAVLALTVVLSLLTVTALPHRASAAPAKAKPACPASRPDEAAALVTARLCGGRVLVSGDESETRQVFAMPDGSLQSTTAIAPVRVQQNGTWVPVDVTLRRNRDGSVSPAALPGDVRLSGAAGAGDHVLAGIGEGATRVSMGWTGALPAPVLSGDTATYSEVLPGIDLKVQVTRTGFEQFIVVKNRAAVARATNLNLPVTSPSAATYVRDAGGNVTLRDKAGRAVAVAAAPEMWDAATVPDKGGPSRRVRLGTSVAKRAAKSGLAAGVDVTLRPDTSWLNDPARVFPVTLDPTVSPVSDVSDTYVMTGDTVDRSGANDLELGAGNGQVARTLINWDTSAFVHSHINSATVYFWNWYSASCTPDSWDIWTTDLRAAGTVWTNQPTWRFKEASTTSTAGFSSSCDDDWVSISGTSFFQRAADGGHTLAGMGVRATNESDANPLRTTTTTYDAAGRQSTVAITGATGTGAALPVQRHLYDQATGQLTHVQSLDSGNNVTADLITGYDTLGRTTSYTDADNNTSTTTYDIAGNTATTNDGKATRTYTYDGGTERRGLATQIVDGQAGTFGGGAYDPDGKLTTETWPNGTVVTHTYDETGTESGIAYTQPGCGQSDCTLYREQIHQSAHDQDADRTSTLSAQRYGYDADGRLTTVNDTVNGACSSRTYTFNSATDRTGLSAYDPASDGSCQTATASASTTWTYDTADRISTSGYVYDSLGRTTTVPAADTQNPDGGNLTATYDVNDLVATMSQGGTTDTYTLDADAQRIRSWNVNDGATVTTKTNHYDSTNDSPAWTDEGDGTWTRSVDGLNGMAAIVTPSDNDWQIVNLHGDCVATIHNTDAGLSAVSEADEYGVLRNTADVGTVRYGWLGAKQRAADNPDGIILMGVRLYSPASGRFLSVDPVPGGSCNRYDYGCQDPTDKSDTDGRWVKLHWRKAWHAAWPSWKKAGSEFYHAFGKVHFVKRPWYAKFSSRHPHVVACAAGAFAFAAGYESGLFTRGGIFRVGALGCGVSLFLSYFN